MVWKITFTTLGLALLSVTVFITHVRILRNGSYTNVYFAQLIFLFDGVVAFSRY